MTAIAAALSTFSLGSLPFAQFKRDSSFYLRYDTAYLLAGIALLLALPAMGYQAPSQTFELWHIALLPVATYVLIIAHVFIHNASHGNFPRAINRIVGEICGVMVLTKFASWEIVHRRHHRHTDDAEKDPHPAERAYWRYAKNTLINVEKQLQMQYFELHGDTPETRFYERWRSRLSFVSGFVLVLCWHELLGAPFFFVLFLPASVMAGLFVIFFNWAGHNAHDPNAKIEPTDLDHGIFWILNRMFFGIFFHGTHHKLAMLFNPMKGAQQRARSAEMRAAEAGAVDAAAREQG